MEPIVIRSPRREAGRGLTPAEIRRWAEFAEIDPEHADRLIQDGQEPSERYLGAGRPSEEV
jgi:hypothetical protein